MSTENYSKLNCPICQKSDQTILMEDLYFAIIHGDKDLLSVYGMDSAKTKKILAEVKPPALEKLPIWLIIKPDLLVIFFVLALMIISLSFINISFESFYKSLWLPAIVSLAYLVFRPRINQYFRDQREKRNQEIKAARLAVDRWLTFFVCLRDQVVFNGHLHYQFPISDTQKQLNKILKQEME